MSDKSQEILLGTITEPPETDADSLEIDQRFDRAAYESSKRDILDHIKDEDFKYMWPITNKDIINQPIQDQAIFIEQALEKISELYDFEFSVTRMFSSKYECGLFYEFLQFLEYNNLSLLETVWKSLNVDLQKTNIKTFLEQNGVKIISEIDRVIKLNQYSEMISLFLRTYYKEKMIEWFYNHTIRNKVALIIATKM
jgi:hypothetical protein